MISPVEDVSLDLLPDDSEDDFDWEEVEVPQAQPGQVELELNLNEQEQEQQPEKHLEIVIKKAGKDESAKKKGISHAERILRIGCHKVHTVSLLAGTSVRNRWLNDELLHARLLSVTPLPLQNAFAMIHPSRVPEQAMRGRMFEAAIGRLVDWWRTSFFEVLPNGHMRNRTFDTMQQRLIAHGYGAGPKKDGEEDVVIDEEDIEDILDDDIEVIRSEKSLMKHVLMQTGSRDTGAQLFTALCRGLGIPARLVVSVQSVPWQAGIGKPKPKYEKKKGKGKGKEKAIETDDNASTAGASSSKPSRLGTPLGVDGAPVEKSEKAKGKEKAKPQIKLRKSKGNALKSKPKVKKIDPLTTPPVFWTEVFSKPDSRWIPVDSLRGIVNKRSVFDPSLDGPNPENRMVYVMAFEEDGYARDVTRRYARNFGAKVAKEQGGSSAIGAGGRGRQQWWAWVVQHYTRPFRLHRDDLEDEELDNAQLIEGMPTTIGGFKDHPLYVLMRHLKQTETIYPPPPETLELGRFRGESVYSRSSVVSLKTAENWLRSEGRSVKAGEQPMKLVKMRASTVNRQREIELLKEGLSEAGASTSTVANGSDGEVMQGLYARRQTEMFVPDPVVEGKVPKNNFGNIDLYVPSMLPKGAVHIPYKGVAKIARKLGIDHAEAVTAFEFRKRRANPVIEGVVVAAENESILLEAFWEAEQDAEEKAKIKREERVIKLWTRLVHGLRIRQRLQEQYANNGGGESSTLPVVNEGERPEEEPKDNEVAGSTEGGGFLVEAADVVESFHLPKYQRIDEDGHLVQVPSANDHTVNGDSTEEQSRLDLNFETMDVDEGEGVRTLSLAPITNPSSGPVIKSMQELAEDAARSASTREASAEVEEITLNPVAKPSVAHTTSADSGRATRTTSRRSTPAGGKKSTLSTKATSKGSSRPSTRRSAKKRKRDDEDGMSSDEEMEEQEVETPSKRPKAAPVTPVTQSTRTLRPRRGKTQAQLLEDEESERAYRRAIAQ
ncbi:hypothetical protein AAF712_003829 [Marasmius tenuissimus]|uniref:Rad4-domain-containing protein n=1 Tax=Marasmius tenuissimus TaxID=585030 RepID=A0ABR3A6C8_9AGAR